MEKVYMSEIAHEFIKGACCTVVINKSADSSMNKGTKANRNPFLGRVMVRKTYSGFVMGTDYSNSLTNCAKRLGSDNTEPNLKATWHKPVDDAVLGEWFSTDKRTETKYYLKLQRNDKQVAMKVVTEYFVDGREATPSEVYLIESCWLKKKSHTQSSTQTEMGIDAAHEQHYILPELSTIVCIKQGDRVWMPKPFEVTSVDVTSKVLVTR